MKLHVSDSKFYVKVGVSDTLNFVKCAIKYNGVCNKLLS